MGEIFAELVLFAVFIVAFVLFIIAFTIYKKIYINVRNSKLYFKAYNDLVTLNRDIDVTYSPAVLSYLYNQKLETKKDVLATIINLYNKNAILIEKENDRYRFLPNDDMDALQISQDEKYLYDCCIIEKEEFSVIKWENIVREEYDKYEFSNRKKTEYLDQNNKKTAKISLVILLISIIITAIVGTPLAGKMGIQDGIAIAKFAMCLIFFIILLFGYMFIQGFNNLTAETRIRLNKKGKTELKKWIKFKRFIKEYTLIKDRKIEEVALYEKYIPYAMVMNLNKEYDNELIQEFIEKYNKTYRDELGPFAINL